MPALQWTFRFYGRTELWVASSVFTLVGIGLLVLAWLVRHEDPIAFWSVGILGTVFFLLGVIVLIMTALKLPEYLIRTIGGMLGALSFGIPATLALPGLLLAYDYRPNVFFSAHATFDSTNWFLGILFTTLGVLTIAGTVMLARYQLKHKTSGWSWHI